MARPLCLPACAYAQALIALVELQYAHTLNNWTYIIHCSHAWISLFFRYRAVLPCIYKRSRSVIHVRFWPFHGARRPYMVMLMRKIAKRGGARRDRFETECVRGNDALQRTDSGCGTGVSLTLNTIMVVWIIYRATRHEHKMDSVTCRRMYIA